MTPFFISYEHINNQFFVANSTFFERKFAVCMEIALLLFFLSNFAVLASGH